VVGSESSCGVAAFERLAVDAMWVEHVQFSLGRIRFYPALIKKKIKFFSYIRKFRAEEAISNI
jgi:hypothetical protein